MKFFNLRDGRHLAFRECGSGPPLVMVHGWAMSSAVFSEAAAAFQGDFRVLVPDLRGHGHSDPAGDYGLADFAADLVEWLINLDLQEVSLLGWSLGGQVALELYHAVRPRIARIILVGTTPKFVAAADWADGLDETQVRAMARDLKRNYTVAMDRFFQSQFIAAEIGRARLRQVGGFAVREGRLPSPAVALAALETLRVADLRPKLPAVDCPALIMHGEADPITLPGGADYMSRYIPQGRLSLMAGTGHAPFLSRPEETFASWREFLL
jgi:pimeloyl-[acyl-carrier protein] methyl ester esterase